LAEVIVALDVPSADEAFSLVGQLGDSGAFYKVGLELYTREGPALVRRLKEHGKKVFLDLKLHDIPNTVAGAVRAAAELEVDLLTLHTLGGRSMLEAAVGAVGESQATDARMRLLGVTVLTSLSATEVETTWGHSILSLRDEVVRLGELGAEGGLDGVVASVLEARELKRKLGAEFLVVTPGIRLPGGESHDQARVATPAAAVRAGADFLVVGRAVTAAEEPRRELERILVELRPPARAVGEARR